MTGGARRERLKLREGNKHTSDSISQRFRLPLVTAAIASAQLQAARRFVNVRAGARRFIEGAHSSHI